MSLPPFVTRAAGGGPLAGAVRPFAVDVITAVDRTRPTGKARHKVRAFIQAAKAADPGQPEPVTRA